MIDTIKTWTAIILFACAAIILFSVVITPMVLATQISLYWLFLYLVYFIAIVGAILWLALKFGYAEQLGERGKGATRKGDDE